MNAIVVPKPGGPEKLQLAQVPIPEPAAGEVLIRVAAAGVNLPDIMQRQGRYNPPPGASKLLGLEVAGEIASVGEGVTDLAAGFSVVALCNGGGYAEYVAVPAGQVLRLPVGLSLLQGAAIPETFFTVEQTLVQRSGLAAGMFVLIHGAAGGIGSAAIRIAVARDAKPIAVVSSSAKADYARQLGAVAVIDHTNEDFVARTLEITEGAGADRIVSIAGGELLDRNLAALARFGTVIQLAVRGGGSSTINLGVLLGKQATLFGSTLRPQTAEAKAKIADGLRRDVWPAFASGRIGPGRVRGVPLAEAARAHAAMEQRDNHGKIVLVTEWGAGLSANNGIAPL